MGKEFWGKFESALVGQFWSFFGRERGLNLATRYLGTY